MKIIRSLVAASAVFFIASSALAQTSPVTNHALAVGKGLGSGFTSLLLGNGQIPIGQTGADPLAVTPTGDVTISAAGVTSVGSLKILTGMIANNAVTLAKLATIANNTALCNVAGSAAVPVACTATQLTTLINAFSATLPGAVPAPGTATGKFLRDDSTWQAAGGTGTVTSVTCGTGLIGGTFTTSGTCAISLQPATTSLGANVALNNTANYFDGPSVAQGTSGTWFASGTVTLTDSAAAQFRCKLWDGTTVIASAQQRLDSAASITHISLSGILSSPAGNIRISCQDQTNTTGSMLFNQTTNSKDSTISVFRIQ